MPCYIRVIQTQFSDLDLLQEAFTNMGAQVIRESETVLRVPTYFGVTFRMKGQEIISRGDANDIRRAIGQVTQEYTRVVIIDEATQQGYQVVQDFVNEDGEIEIIVEAW